MTIGMILLVGTAAAYVFAEQLTMGWWATIFLIFGIASFKVSLVALYFMHLKFEGKWKYIQGDSRRYLFDLDRDISERRNLIERYPEIAERLAARLEKWSRELDPPGLNQPLGQAGGRYFDHYLDGKEVEAPTPAA